jgi:hypothetical protein
MYFFTTGKPALPIRFDDKRQEARFTLKDKNHRYYVVTTCMEQYELLKAHPNQELLIIGTAYSFKVGFAHQVGFKPMLLLPLNGNVEEVKSIAAQLVKSTLEEVANPEKVV